MPGHAFGVNNNRLVAGIFLTPMDHEETGTLATVTQDDQDHGEEEMFGHSFLWDANLQSLVAVHQIVGASSTIGRKVNEHGQVVGQVEFPAVEEEGKGEAGNDEGRDYEHGVHERQPFGCIRQADGTISTFAIPCAHKTFIGGINNDHDH